MDLLAQMHKTSLPSLVIGGHAVISYGVPRSTFDFDFLVRKDDRENWRSVMVALGYKIFYESDPFQQWSPPEGQIAVDLMLVDEATWQKLDAGAREIVLGELKFRAVSPDHLIALKLHAMKFRSGHHAEKDWQDIVGLVAACKLDPAGPELLLILGKYASPQTRERFLNHYGMQT
jgi:hypothetical protein